METNDPSPRDIALSSGLVALAFVLYSVAFWSKIGWATVAGILLTPACIGGGLGALGGKGSAGFAAGLGIGALIAAIILAGGYFALPGPWVN